MWPAFHQPIFVLLHPKRRKPRDMDNIFIERLWRSLKYEAVYLHELTDGFKAKRVIDDWPNFYNGERPHSSFGGRTPAEVYGTTHHIHRLHNSNKM
jgi:putative transposase